MNAVTPAFPACIGLPAEIVRAHAHRPAFAGPEPVSYGAFAERVDVLAGRLVDMELRSGDRVAIWMDKSSRYAEAIFAALHAGCAYVPLHGGQPVGRVTTILADAEPSVLFTDPHRLLDLAEGELPSSVRAVVVDAPEDHPALPEAVGGAPVMRWSRFAATGAGRVTLLPSVARDDLAALLYTSGSTGVPKGVQLTHRNLAAFVGWAHEEFAVGPEDVFANHASFNFDLSTFDLFVALSVGASVWVIGDEQSRDVTALADGIREHGVTVWYSVPSVLHLLAASGVLRPEVVERLRYVLFAGEVFPVPQLRALAGWLPGDTALYNLYGPTETNVCTYHRVRPQDLDGEAPVPIGRPVSGARLRVLDESGQELTRPGDVGELVVEGDCVTPGYWRRDGEAAAEQHRLGRHPTGDLVAYDVEGLLVYRGRRDRMVKLSGYRIELGEIEAAVLAHPDIADAAVIVAGEGAQGRLELYYTLRGGADRLTLLEIKRHCVQHLPTYMVPHRVTRLDELPRSANGKTDHRRLRDDQVRPSAAPSGAAR